MSSELYKNYREKYLNAPSLNLEAPVDISLELSSLCNMRCSYCLDPETPVLGGDLIWKPIKEFKAGDSIVGFDEYAKNGNRKMYRSKIEKTWDTKKQAIRVITNDGEFICSMDHKFLDQSSRWTEAINLKIGSKIKFAKTVWDNYNNNNSDYMCGYLLGMTEGDGTARWQPLPGATGHESDSRRQVWWRIAITDMKPLEKVISCLEHFKIEHNGIKDFNPGSSGYQARLSIYKVEIRAKKTLNQLENLIFNYPKNETDDYARGYLAGIFDSEGSCSTVLRIAQKKQNNIIDKIIFYAQKFDFDFVVEKSGARLLGGIWEMIRFHATAGTTISRHRSDWENKGIKHKTSTVLNVEKLGERKLIDIQTECRTFYAAGFPTHNCYHADKKNLPFTQQFMQPTTFKNIVSQAAELGVNSLKFNWRGESTMNPYFLLMTKFAKERAVGSTFIDRLTNSNFKFDTKRDDIFEALCNQTKVKVSYDSFNKEVFEAQRTGGDHDITSANIDKFYNWPGRDNKLVIQAVRTSRNANEDLEAELQKRWPEAELSVRDMVEGRVNKDLDEMKHKERDYSERQSCIQFHARLIFDWNGEATGCCPDINMMHKLGNIKDNTVYEIFNSDTAKLIRKRLLNKRAFRDNPCRDCSSFETFKSFVPQWDS